MRQINTRILTLCCAAACLAGVGWFANQTVRPECDVAISVFTDSNGDPLPDQDGKRWTVHELTERAYWEKVRDGACEPPSARWRQWFN